MTDDDQKTTSPISRPGVSIDDLAPSFDEDLPWIIMHYRDRVSAAAVVLTVHYDDKRAPETVFRDEDDNVSGTFRPNPPDECGQSQSSSGKSMSPAMWWEGGGSGQHHALSLSLARNDDSCAVISAIFEASANMDRAATEAAAQRFHAVLTGYFKLWLLARSMRRRIDLVIAALDETDVGIVVLDRNADIVFENGGATRMLDIGTALQRKGRSVTAEDLIERVKLSLAIEEVLAHGEEAGPDACNEKTILLNQPGRDTPFVVTVKAVTDRGSGRKDPAVVLQLFSDNLNFDRSAGLVCLWFGLSPLETRLAKALVQGATVSEIAKREEIKEATVRTYLKNVFRQTGTNSQTGLLRLLMCNPVRISEKIEPRPNLSIPL